MAPAQNSTRPRSCLWGLVSISVVLCGLVWCLHYGATRARVVVCPRCNGTGRAPTIVDVEQWEWLRCPECEGTGKVTWASRWAWDAKIVCPKCQGAGWQWVQDTNSIGFFELLTVRLVRVNGETWYRTRCPECKGFGRVDWAATGCCDQCGGRGWQWDVKQVAVRVKEPCPDCCYDDLYHHGVRPGYVWLGSCVGGPPGGGWTVCSLCGGRGYIEKEQSAGQWVRTPCSTCRGTGKPK